MTKYLVIAMVLVLGLWLFAGCSDASDDCPSGNCQDDGGTDSDTTVGDADGDTDANADADVGGDIQSDTDAENSEGCWIDPLSGLEWEVKSSADTDPRCDWYEALSRCEDLMLCGNTNWRMPTISELRSFIRGCPSTEIDGDCPVIDGYTGTELCEGCSPLGGPGLVGCYWSETLPETAPQFCSSQYWSSSTYFTDTSFVWIVSFASGYITYGGKTGSGEITERLVRCVRSGP